jgi:hypothetical protein
MLFILLFLLLWMLSLLLSQTLSYFLPPICSHLVNWVRMRYSYSSNNVESHLLCRGPIPTDAQATARADILAVFEGTQEEYQEEQYPLPMHVSRNI